MFYFLPRCSVNGCCTTLQAHVRIEMDLVLTKYWHDNGYFSSFYFNMNKPKASNKYLKVQYCPIRQIVISPAQIAFPKSTIYDKVN